jgi:hypothetical protein
MGTDSKEVDRRDIIQCENCSIARPGPEQKNAHDQSGKHDSSISPTNGPVHKRTEEQEPSRTSLLVDRIGERPVTSQTCSSNSPGCRPVRGPSESSGTGSLGESGSGSLGQWEATGPGTRSRIRLAGNWPGSHSMAGALPLAEMGRGRDGWSLESWPGGEWREKGLGRASDDS